MKNILNNFLLYIQFFTRIPVNKELKCDENNFIKGTPYFPIVGLIIGLAQYLVYLIFSFSLNSLITSILVVLASILLTGALHLDGFGDCADGFFAFKGGKDKIIEIMKDSRIGAFACVAIVFNILLKTALIDSSITIGVPQLIIASPIIGRFSIVFLSTIGKNAKPQGTGNLFIGKVKWENFFGSLIITMLASYVLIGNASIVLIVSSLVFSYGFDKFCEKKIGGLSGDTLGANNELIEIMNFIVYFTYLSLQHLI